MVFAGHLRCALSYSGNGNASENGFCCGDDSGLRLGMARIVVLGNTKTKHNRSHNPKIQRLDVLFRACCSHYIRLISTKTQKWRWMGGQGKTESFICSEIREYHQPHWPCYFSLLSRVQVKDADNAMHPRLSIRSHPSIKKAVLRCCINMKHPPSIGPPGS
ncbi:hypothetical protein LY76DRAFT_257194 [Colletotrichum caudatum]|nr:hypothetical protein LY76DRAFT_257194 [Colletotrichum caudatum]